MWSSTYRSFSMFMRHMCSGRPVVADCWRTNSSGVWLPSPSGSSADEKSSAAFFTFASRSATGTSRNAARARGRLAQVAGDDAGVGLAHLGHRFAGVEVHHLVDVEAPVGLAPPERGEVNHDALSAPAPASETYCPSVTSMLIVAQRPSCVRC